MICGVKKLIFACFFKARWEAAGKHLIRLLSEALRSNNQPRPWFSRDDIKRNNLIQKQRRRLLKRLHINTTAANVLILLPTDFGKKSHNIIKFVAHDGHDVFLFFFDCFDASAVRFGKDLYRKEKTEKPSKLKSQRNIKKQPHETVCVCQPEEQESVM